MWDSNLDEIFYFIVTQVILFGDDLDPEFGSVSKEKVTQKSNRQIFMKTLHNKWILQLWESNILLKVCWASFNSLFMHRRMAEIRWGSGRCVGYHNEWISGELGVKMGDGPTRSLPWGGMLRLSSLFACEHFLNFTWVFSTNMMLRMQISFRTMALNQ